MQDKETEKLQITYYKNMEFFRDFNPKLFSALTKTPTLYNLHIDSYGYNIIHIPTQKKQYPLIARKDINTQQVQTISPETHTTSMQEAHNEIAENPLKNPKWELFSNQALQAYANFIDENRLPITGKHCNALLRKGIQIGLESYNNETSKNINKDSKEKIQAKNLNHCNQNNIDAISNKAGHKIEIEDNKTPLNSNDSLSQSLLDSINTASNICNKNTESNIQNEPKDDESHYFNSAIKDIKIQNDIESQSNDILYKNFLESFCNSYFLPQTNIYGLMGGLFLQKLIDRGYYFYGLLIYEDNIDLFRISLYFLDYAKLFSHVSPQSCFIIIKDISFELVSAFLYAKKLTNNFLSLSLTQYTTQNITLLKDFIYKEKKAVMRGWGSLEDELVGFHNACINLKDCKLLSSKPKRIHAPICVIGNGASLDLCIDFLKTYQDSMILLSCGTALKVLRHHGIKPDFQIEIERVPYLSNVLMEAGLEDIPLIFAQTTDTKACNLSVEKYGFLRGGSSSAYLDSMKPALEFSAPFVGNAGVSVAALLGSDVILCGIDCGYIKGYSKHAKQSFYGLENTDIPNDCFQVQGNKNLAVFSNDLFYLSAKNIEQALKLYQPNNTINLGYGMRFQHTLSLNEDSFTLQSINKEKEIKNFKENFTDYNLKLDIDNMIDNLDSWGNALQDIIKQDINDIQDIFTLTQNVFVLLQKGIDNITMRPSIILLEGSIMHLSYSHLLSQLFAGLFVDILMPHTQQITALKQNHINTLKHLYTQGILDIIHECKKLYIEYGQ